MPDRKKKTITWGAAMSFIKRCRFPSLFIVRIIVLVLILAVTGGLAVAQTGEPVATAPKSKGKPPVPPENHRPQPRSVNSAQVILYDQTDNQGSNSFASQAFEPALAHFDSQGADDFIIPVTDDFWVIERVEVLGSYSENGGPTPFVNVYFYTDAAGLPGTMVYSATQVAPADDRIGDLVIDLPSPVMLSASTYWLSIQADLDFDPNGQWFWNTRVVQSNSPFVWQNPGEGFNLGCPTWAPGSSVCGLGGDEPDALFRLFGTVPIPQSFQLDWSSFEVDDTKGIAWGDYDGDGDLDLAVGNGDPQAGGRRNRLYRNDDGILTTRSVWSSDEVDPTESVAWGDYDGDGDLDLVAGNSCDLNPDVICFPNRLYRNDDGVLTTSAVWSSDEVDATDSIAWGDYDGDGNLDLAVGNGLGQPNRLYRNDGGVLTSNAIWSSDEADSTTSVAWGDYDDDGDLDLAVGNGRDQSNRLYRNDGGVLTFSAIWSSDEAASTTSVAWGDYDDDGDLDLAVGNTSGTPNRLYRNEDGALTANAIWSSDEVDPTTGVAWGDYDGDGDLDLAVGNGAAPNQLYRNDDGILTTRSVWSTDEVDATDSIAWGDYDGDGDLDLAVGNGAAPNRLYRNDDGILTTRSVWSTDEVDATDSIAWGDYDGDGDLDLAVGNISGTSSRLYRNDGGAPTASAVWSSDETDLTTSVAWGDYDGDGDLDLAVGNGEAPSRLYRNDGGALTASAVWSSDETDLTTSVAWGDYDGDGDLDLAVGNLKYNRLYRNDGGALMTTAVWSSVEDDDTTSIAWGDYNKDSDLDLAVGNDFIGFGGEAGRPNRLYRNDDGIPTGSAVWSSSESDDTTSIAWGDYDGDGDLDLAVGNSRQPNRIYLNDGGMLTASPVWSSIEADTTYSVAWGDYDGDGDLDLAVGNELQPNRLYRNDRGMLTLSAVWSSADSNETESVAWGDYDGDGDLDLAVGNRGQSNYIYQNLRRSDVSSMDNPPYAAISRPGVTDDADFFSTPYIIQSANVPIHYTLFDFEGGNAAKIFPEFSPSGGGQWFSATPGPGGDGLTNLPALPEGTPHTFVWHAEADLIKSDNVVFRIRAQPNYTHSPILWPAQDGQSPPFRVEAPWYIKVVDQNGHPIVGTTVYADGQPITQTVTGSPVTNQAGLLNPGQLPEGTALVALVQQVEQPAIRDVHDGWAYRTYLTNIEVDEVGDTQPFIVGEPGPQVLTVRPENTLILFNLVVSAEWDATEVYLQDLALAIERAADFLYDATDGQMTFGRVAIYDQAAHWTEADIQISAKNVIQPHAHIGGLTDDDPAHLIRVGRFWDGNRGDQGAWSEPNGFRTLVHEFGHYGLGLYDEYFGYDYRGADLAGEHEAWCIGQDLFADASIMNYHYEASELADVGRWTPWCQETAQHQLNHGEADWQTLLRRYSDPSGQDRWRLLTPDGRGGSGHVVPGPDAVPSALPFPEVTIANQGYDPAPMPLQVCHNGQPYQEGVWVTLYASGKALDQGLTTEDGQLDILGARPGDTLQVVSLEGTLSASALLPLGGPVELAASEKRSLRSFLPDLASLSVEDILALGAQGIAASANEAGPYLRLWPTTSGGHLDGLRLVTSRTLPDDNLAFTLTGPDDIGPVGAMVYEPTENDHRAQVSFIPPALAGHARVLGAHDDRFIDINADYRLQQADNFSSTTLFANDGNLKLYLEPGSLPVDKAYFLLASPWGLPGPLPDGLEIVGEAYEITASANVTGLTKPAVLTLHYDGATGSDFTDLAIYRWDFRGATWQRLSGTLSEEHQTVATTITDLGLYTLMGVLTATNSRYQPAWQADLTNPCGVPEEYSIYLPFILKP